MKHLLLILALCWIAGCATAPGGDSSELHDELSAGIWDVEAGELLEFEEFVLRIEEPEFVIVGESHGTAWHHEVQVRIYDAVSEGRPGEVALGMEMVQRRFQNALDDYVDRQIDEAQMLQRVGWEERWGVDFEFYAPMWRLARELGQPVVALNARREMVSRVADVGLDGVDAQEQAELPEIDVSNEAYREHLRQIFAAHGSEIDEEGLDRFYQAQLVWDETMAETAWEFMSATSDVRQMVIVTGRGHVERRFGIPSRLERRGAGPTDVVTVVAVSGDGERVDAMRQYRDLDFLRDEEIADYVWIQP